MRIPFYSKQFEKDVELQKERGKNLKKLKEIMTLLVKGERLSLKNRDHPLIGNFRDYRECHIESDWLLIYKIEGACIYFTRNGTHSDMFE